MRSRDADGRRVEGESFREREGEIGDVGVAGEGGMKQEEVDGCGFGVSGGGGKKCRQRAGLAGRGLAEQTSGAVLGQNG
jgi:hypothetical protein